MLLSLGVHPKVVQEILGHSQISMTMDIYSLVLPTMQQEAMSKLNDALRGVSIFVLLSKESREFSNQGVKPIERGNGGGGIRTHGGYSPHTISSRAH